MVDFVGYLEATVSYTFDVVTTARMQRHFSILKKMSMHYLQYTGKG